MKLSTLVITIIVIVVVTRLIHRSMSKKQSAFNALDEAEPWLIKEGIDVNSFRYNAYNDAAIVKHFDAVALVGVGTNALGKNIAVMLEVIQGKGVIEYEYIVPEGIANRDKDAARMAKLNGEKLLNVLSDMAYDHREKYSIKHPEL